MAKLPVMVGALGHTLETEAKASEWALSHDAASVW